MLGAQYRCGCVRNVKTLELVLNVVSISGHEAGQKKVFLHETKVRWRSRGLYNSFEERLAAAWALSFHRCVCESKRKWQFVASQAP